MNQVQTSFHYRMELVFDGPVQRHHYTLKCLPGTNLRQQILRADTHLLPAGHAWESKDSFGNRELLGLMEEPHETFSVQVEGEAILPVAGENYTLYPEDYTLYPEEEVKVEKLGIYRYPTALTRPGAKIQTYYEQLMRRIIQERQAGEDRWQNPAGFPCIKIIAENGEVENADFSDTAAMAVELMHHLHEDFAYQKAATDVTTTAEQAFLRGAGVCQDYAHIFISLLRLCGIPARYVTGMLRGEGESHAWVEIALGKYWYGLDPTNDCAVAGAHIKIGTGRDFADCRISQGIFFGCGNIRQQQIVRVSVEQQ